jgi:hypothetical protein
MASHRLATALAALAALAAPLHAQVGYDPAKSPFRDIRSGTFITLSGGYFFGNGGEVAVAPHDGPTAGLQVSFLANRTISVSGGFNYGWLERTLIDPSKPREEQATGSVTHGTVFLDAGLTFNVTGNKSWHRLAPYAGVAIGVSFTDDVPEDPGGFRMGTKFTFAPLIGTRVFLFGNSYLLAEGRFQFWQISYPTTYAQLPFPVIPTGVLEEWSLTPWVRVGLGFPWRWPF